MKICITGGAGMIGSSLTRKLIQNNNVVVVDNLWRGKVENLADIQSFSIENDFYNLDLSDINNTEEIRKIISDCDCLIHLADIVAGIGYVFNNQYEIFRINNLINSNVFNAAAKEDIPKIIYANTACSFPKNLQNSLEAVLREDQLFPAEPESAYGWSKLMGTLELQYLKEHRDIKICSLILHNVYGPYCDLDTQRSQVIPSLIRKIIELGDKEELVVWGSGNQGRAFLYVDDVVKAIEAVTINDDIPDIIQIGPDICTSIKTLVEILRNKIIKKDFDIRYDHTKPEGDKGRAADYSLARQHLGWSPSISIEDGLKKTYKWILQQLT